MKRCIVTGASGLIGSHLLPSLIDEWEVHATTRRGPVGLRDGVRWHSMDLRAPDTSVLPDRADAVVYLAQSEHFREFPEKAQAIFDVNVAAVLQFLEYARRSGARTFVLASSGGVYPSSDSGLSEDLEIATRRDLGFYLGTKLCSEILAEQYTPLFTVVMLRFFFVYGPGQAPHMLVPRLVRSVETGTPITLTGQEGIRINPTYVDDAVRATVRSLTLPESHRINIGGPEVVTLRELADTIGGVVGRAPVFAVDAAAQPRHLFADVSKMRNLLHAPTVTLRDGIERLVRAMSPAPAAGNGSR